MMNKNLLAPFDTETTGTSVENDRILTAFIGVMDRSTKSLTEKHDWLIDVGQEIPAGATAIHGITTEKMVAEGRKDVGMAVFEIAQRIDILDRQAIPFVIFNAPFDLTLTDRELRRHMGIKNFRAPHVVIDPMVLDKAIDPFRKGKRTLTVTAAHYGVPVLENAHDAEADCIMAGQLAIEILKHPKLVNLSLEQIHEKSIAAKVGQQTGFRRYLYGKNDKDASASIEAARLDSEFEPNPEAYFAKMEAEIRNNHKIEKENIGKISGEWPMYVHPENKE